MSCENDVKKIWRHADCVCFDVDSTLCKDEGIDELATYLHKGEEVKKLTLEAMTGLISYKESLAQRLQIISPAVNQINAFIAEKPPQLTSGARELCSLLQHRNVPIFLISGGFDCIIEPVASLLNIPKENIHANRLKFYFHGDYAGFDDTLPTCNGDGKKVVIKALKETYNFQQLIHIGDGVTDMEACPPADAFIGFGGNQIRPKVKDGAKWFVTSFQELINELCVDKPTNDSN